MGFIRGVFAGIAVAVGAAAWYMSRAGAKFRDRYRVDRRLGQLGDEVEMRTREVRARASAQMNAARDQMTGNDMGSRLDDAQAAAAEEAAEIAADVEAKAGRVKRAAKSAEAEAEADAEG